LIYCKISLSQAGLFCFVVIPKFAKHRTQMQKEDCYQVGHVTRTHGLKGEVTIFLDVDSAADYAEMDSVLLETKGQLIPYFIQNINIQRDSKAIVKFEGVTTIEQAKLLVGSVLFLPEDVLDELDNTQFYYHEVIDYQIVDTKMGALGKITTVYDLPNQDLIAMSYRGREVLIPINDEMVLTIDREQKILNVNLPDGLIEVYLEEGKQDDGYDNEN
jgi:16S rRNA processing protein RimM